MITTPHPHPPPHRHTPAVSSVPSGIPWLCIISRMAPVASLSRASKENTLPRAALSLRAAHACFYQSLKKNTY
jgi:hypothetical protein